MTEVVKSVEDVLAKAQEGTWSWARNPECKYVDIRIDMRDGRAILRDRDGRKISVDRLLKQNR